ncbi:MAG: hypothetical protein HY775_02485 [Acidobacteria bacterium]|nr:hypothetical protein [Acidobacteriota bacterium]
MGQEVPLPVPLLTLPKQVLMRTDLEDHRGHRLPLGNRFRNSELATHYVITRSIWPASTFLASEFSPPIVTPLIRALAFCIPSGLLHRANFTPKCLLLSEAPEDSAAKMIRFLARRVRLEAEDEMSDVPAIMEARVQGLIESGRTLAERLKDSPDLTWAHVQGLRDPLTNPLLLLPDYVKLRMKGGWGTSPPTITQRLTTFFGQCDAFLALIAGLVDVQSAPGEGSRACENALFTLSRFTHS